MPLAPPRTVAPGATLRLLVLSSDAELIGIDLASGALVRGQTPYGDDDVEDLDPFEVVEARLSDEDAPVGSLHAPESVQLDHGVRRVGRLSGRRAERLLRPFLHPGHRHVLGLPGPAVPYWTLAGDRPSLDLVAPSAGPAVLRTAHGFRCRFSWRGRDHDLPLGSMRLASRLEGSRRRVLTSEEMRRVLGYQPTRVLTALTAPHGGHCYKVVAALLPRP